MKKLKYWQMKILRKEEISWKEELSHLCYLYSTHFTKQKYVTFDTFTQFWPLQNLNFFLGMFTYIVICSTIPYLIMHKSIPVTFGFLPARHMVINHAMLTTGCAHITFELWVSQVDLPPGRTVSVATRSIRCGWIFASSSEVWYCNLRM